MSRFMRVAVAAAVAGAFSQPVGAQEIEALKRELEALKKEVQELRQAIKQAPASSDEVQALRREVQEVAKEAGEFRGISSPKHFAGAGAVGYSSAKGSKGRFDTAVFAPTFHYQYQDLVLLDAELEIGVLDTGETEVGLELATISFLASDYAAVYAGKFNSGIGQFRQNLHSEWINRLPSVPVGFGEEGEAAPLTEVGAGVRGAVPIGSMRATYDVWLGNGPRLTLNGAADEIERIDSKGATGNDDGKKVWGGRIGLFPLPRLELGLSAGRGKVAVVQGGVAEPVRDYRAFGADAAYQVGNLDLRAERVEQKVGDLEGSVAPAGGRWKAYYAQAAYRFSPTKWEGVLRYGNFKTPHADQDQKQWAAGVNYWFAPNFVGKVAYEFNKGLADTPTDADRLLFQAAYGF